MSFEKGFIKRQLSKLKPVPNFDVMYIERPPPFPCWRWASGRYEATLAEARKQLEKAGKKKGKKEGNK